MIFNQISCKNLFFLHSKSKNFVLGDDGDEAGPPRFGEDGGGDVLEEADAPLPLAAAE